VFLQSSCSPVWENLRIPGLSDLTLVSVTTCTTMYSSYHHHIWQNRTFERYSSPESSARFDRVFISSDFATVFFLHSKDVSLASNPQPGGPGPVIYVPQWQGGPVIPPDTGFPFRRLLRLAVLRWRYSNPPPHGGPVPVGCKIERGVLILFLKRTDDRWCFHLKDTYVCIQQQIRIRYINVISIMSCC
jgi:hypothetical protein